MKYLIFQNDAYVFKINSYIHVYIWNKMIKLFLDIDRMNEYETEGNL